MYTYTMTEPVFIQPDTTPVSPPSAPLTPQEERERKLGIAIQTSRSFLGIVGTGLAKIYREIMMMILRR